MDNHSCGSIAPNAPEVNYGSYERNLIRLVHLYYDRRSPTCSELDATRLDQQIITLHRWFAADLKAKAKPGTWTDLNYRAGEHEKFATDYKNGLYGGWSRELRHRYEKYHAEASVLLNGYIPEMNERITARRKLLVKMAMPG